MQNEMRFSGYQIQARMPEKSSQNLVATNSTSACDLDEGAKEHFFTLQVRMFSLYPIRNTSLAYSLKLKTCSSFTPGKVSLCKKFSSQQFKKGEVLTGSSVNF
jgi:hypothetical protein